MRRDRRLLLMKLKNTCQYCKNIKKMEKCAMNKYSVVLILIVPLCSFFLMQCDEEPVTLTDAEIKEWQEKMRNTEAVPVEEGEIAVLETSMGIIKFKFFTDVAPNHCANFKKLANSGFYDWVTFHRVIPGFMIQGGDINSKNADPDDDGTGSPGYTIDAEFSALSHVRGIVSTARKGDDINSAGSQFFIMHTDNPGLDWNYTVFGEVIEGMDVVDAIANASSNESDRPLRNIYIKNARVIKQ